MSSKRTADVVFCLDASNSMQPALDGVRAHLGDFVAGLKSSAQGTWDVRFDFLAYRASDVQDGAIFSHDSLRLSGLDLIQKLYATTPQTTLAKDFFTTNIDEFKTSLARIKPSGDEAPLVALDTALDFPWRESANCHRVVILMTDEPFETGACMDFQKQQLPQLIQKIQDLRVMLFLVAPQSAVFDQLAAVDKSEYQVIDNNTGDGLRSVNFNKVLMQIGKSVSVSLQTSTMEKKAIPRGLYRQHEWTGTKTALTGA
jgi:hypothetical protein